MSKYFIKCALEAALAAKNHGFKYYTKLVDANDVNWLDPGCYINLRGSWVVGKYYIADESLALLEIQIGDILIANYKSQAEYVFHIMNDDSAYEIARYKSNCPDGRIIFRNNLPFPKIEVDDE